MSMARDSKGPRSALLPAAVLLLVGGIALGCGDDTSGDGSSSSGSGGSGGEGTGGNTTDPDVDDDGDGFTEDDGDCDDLDDSVHPDAEEVCDDDTDNNCNGGTDENEPDGDGDGFGMCAGDCDDDNPDIHPAAEEVVDSIDNNCDGIVDADFDGDGVTEDDGDCDDDDPTVYPGAPESCDDGADNDCNGFTDDEEPDSDGDGYGPCDGDCNEGDPDIGPDEPEIPGDGIDNNCDNLVDLDIDGDGWTEQNGDCEDDDPLINPAAIEDCNDNVDNNCNGETDTDCLTPCEVAAIQRSSVGCVYYAVDTNPLQSGQKAVAISNIDTAVSANVTVEVKNGATWSTIGGGSVTVGPLALQTVNLPHRNINGTAVYAGGAYRITSDLPVIAYQFNPINGASSFLSDASLLLPKSSLDQFYITPGWPYGRDISNVLRATHLQIAATEDDTTVLLTSSTQSTNGTSGAPTFQSGVQNSVVLQEGDFLQVTVQNENGSFAGSYVEADKPISVFTSNDCANVPFGSGNCCCEHLEENIFGLQTWGTTYVGARAPQRIAEQSVWQVTAQQPGTVVTFDANVQVTGMPPGNTDTLAAGETKEYSINGPLQNPGDFLVTASDPILLTQYTVGSFTVQNNGSDGDPSQVQAVPVEQFLDQYVVLVPSTWVNDFVILTRESGATVNLDGNPVNSGWVQVGSSNYEVARVSVGDGVHVLDGTAPFGVQVLGWDTYDSYAYPGGLDQKLINPVN